MTASLSIRPAAADDLQPCIELLSAAGLPVADISIDRIALIAERQLKVVGLIGLEAYDAVGLLRSLVVDQRLRGAGVGRQLVGALEQYAGSRGVNELWLLTIDADLFFERLGYCRENRDAAPAAITATDEFSELCPASAVLMSKRLST